MPKGIIIAVAVMLFVALLPLPYAYYQLLRLVVCGVFAFGAYVAYERKLEALPWILGVGAILFNPIAPIHLSREIWAVIDVAAGAFLLSVSGKIGTESQAQENS